MTEAERDALQVGDTIKYNNAYKYGQKAKDLYWKILSFHNDRTSLTIKSLKTNAVSDGYSYSFLLEYCEFCKSTDIASVEHPIARLQKLLGDTQ